MENNIVVNSLTNSIDSFTTFTWEEVSKEPDYKDYVVTLYALETTIKQPWDLEDRLGDDLDILLDLKKKELMAKRVRKGIETLTVNIDSVPNFRYYFATGAYVFFSIYDPYSDKEIVCSTKSNKAIIYLNENRILSLKIDVDSYVKRFETE